MGFKQSSTMRMTLQVRAVLITCNPIAPDLDDFECVLCMCQFVSTNFATAGDPERGAVPGCKESVLAWGEGGRQGGGTSSIEGVAIGVRLGLWKGSP